MGGGGKSGGGSSTYVVGHRYYAGLHLALCHGPVDAVTRIIVGERTAWSGSITSSQTIYINAPQLFGGDSREGGVQGYVEVKFALGHLCLADAHLLGLAADRPGSGAFQETGRSTLVDSGEAGGRRIGDGPSRA